MCKYFQTFIWKQGTFLSSSVGQHSRMGFSHKCLAPLIQKVIGKSREWIISMKIIIHIPPRLLLCWPTFWDPHPSKSNITMLKGGHVLMQSRKQLCSRKWNPTSPSQPQFGSSNNAPPNGDGHCAIRQCVMWDLTDFFVSSGRIISLGPRGMTFWIIPERPDNQPPCK